MQSNREFAENTSLMQAKQDRARWHAAWWSCVAESGDEMANAVRDTLGDEEAQTWLLADYPERVPQQLVAAAQYSVSDWSQAHARWHPRAVNAKPDEDFGVLEGLGGRFVIPGDSEWPRQLDDLGPQKPHGLWVLGTLPSGVGCSIVGARASTQYGNRNSYDISSELASHSITVVSGGAFGVDIAAHRGALDASGHTTAVMAGGVGQLYPASHQSDFRRIIDHGGAVISEAPPMWRPARWRFLARNRLIAALGMATVLIEAGLRSGALSTVRHALSLGREVGALPGMVTQELSKGCHEAIRNGATLVRNGRDVMELLELNPEYQDVLFGAPTAIDQGIDALAREQRRVWEALPVRTEMKLERIITESGLSRQETLAALAALELTGYVHSTLRGWKRVAK